MSVGDSSDSQNTKPVRLLAICKSGDAIRPAITFLARRSVHITVVSTMHEALERLAQKDTDYVFLSVTFPHNKLETIPALLNQTFGLDTIFFADKWDRKSEAKMGTIKHKHMLFGPVSGPAIHLKIRQLEKAEVEAENIKISESNFKSESDVDNSRIEITQQKAQQTSGNFIISGDSHKSAPPDPIAKLMQMLGDEASAETHEQSRTAASAKTFVAKGKPPTKLAPVMPEKNKSRGMSVFTKDPRMKDSPFKESKPALSPMRSAVQESPASAASEKLATMAASIAASSEMAAQTSSSIQQASEKSAQASSPAHEAMKATQGSPQALEQKNRAAPMLNNLGAPLKRVPDKVQGHAKLFQIWESARRAVMDVSKAVDVYETAITQVSGLAFVSISSPGVNGCFLMTIGSSSGFPSDTLAELQSRFLFHLRESGKEVKDSEVSSVEIDTSTLPDGAFIDSDFSITASTERAQISISFLDIKHESPEVESTAIEDFSKIKVKDIATGVPLTFDAYIYMPLNQKTLKYLKQGGILGLKQKTKLMDDGTEHLYIKEYSILNFKEFHARSSLQEELDKRKDAANSNKKKVA